MLQQIRDAFHPTEIIAEICPAYRHASLWPEARASAEIASAIRLASCWGGNAMISPLEMMLPTGRRPGEGEGRSCGCRAEHPVGPCHWALLPPSACPITVVPGRIVLR